jgi:hypothetical protein
MEALGFGFIAINQGDGGVSSVGDCSAMTLYSFDGRFSQQTNNQTGKCKTGI